MRISHHLSLEKKIVVIVGAGFGGLSAAKVLANQSGVHVILIDKKNHHLFQPLLYQVATAALNPSDIAVPIRSEFRDVPNVEVYLGKVKKVDLVEKYIEAEGIELHFDYLILACGAENDYFGHPEWAIWAPSLKTLEEATEIRRRILYAFERAENEIDAVLQQSYLTFAIIGGGPTGVELAGAIAEISRTVLVKDFKRINPADAKVILIEGGQRILSGFSSSASDHAVRDLRTLGVEVRLNTRATNVSELGVHVGNELIQCRSTFWAAGVRARHVELVPRSSTDDSGRLFVDKRLALAEFPNVFAVGDMAAFKDGDQMLPGIAPVAIQQGKFVAHELLRSIRSCEPRSFVYKHRGIMATIGKNRAVAELGSFKLYGNLAWLLWLFVHLLSLTGFKNRFSVVSQWIWSYVFSKRGARLITSPGSVN